MCVERVLPFVSQKSYVHTFVSPVPGFLHSGLFSQHAMHRPQSDSKIMSRVGRGGTLHSFSLTWGELHLSWFFIFHGGPTLCKFLFSGWGICSWRGRGWDFTVKSRTSHLSIMRGRGALTVFINTGHSHWLWQRLKWLKCFVSGELSQALPEDCEDFTNCEITGFRLLYLEGLEPVTSRKGETRASNRARWSFICHWNLLSLFEADNL